MAQSCRKQHKVTKLNVCYFRRQLEESWLQYFIWAYEGVCFPHRKVKGVNVLNIAIFTDRHVSLGPRSSVDTSNYLKMIGLWSTSHNVDIARQVRQHFRDLKRERFWPTADVATLSDGLWLQHVTCSHVWQIYARTPKTNIYDWGEQTLRNPPFFSSSCAKRRLPEMTPQHCFTLWVFFFMVQFSNNHVWFFCPQHAKRLWLL